MSYRSSRIDVEGKFTTAEKKLLRELKLPEEYTQKVDMQRVNLAVMKPWIAQRITALLAFEDEVVIDFAIGMLEEERYPDARRVHLNMTGFLEDKTTTFVGELWRHLLSAQDSPGGVVREFVEAKKQELRARQAEDAAIETTMQRVSERDEPPRGRTRGRVRHFREDDESRRDGRGEHRRYDRDDSRHRDDPYRRDDSFRDDPYRHPDPSRRDGADPHRHSDRRSRFDPYERQHYDNDDTYRPSYAGRTPSSRNHAARERGRSRERVLRTRSPSRSISPYEARLAHRLGRRALSPSGGDGDEWRRPQKRAEYSYTRSPTPERRRPRAASSSPSRSPTPPEIVERRARQIEQPRVPWQ